MKDHYFSLRVKERTRRLAKELSATAGLPIKDYLQRILEREKEETIEQTQNRRKIEKKMGFDFKW